MQCLVQRIIMANDTRDLLQTFVAQNLALQPRQM